MNNVAFTKQKAAKERSLLFGLLHFMRRSGLNDAQISKALTNRQPMISAFRGAVYKTLVDTGMTPAQAKEIVGGVCRADLDQPQLLDTTAAK